MLKLLVATENPANEHDEYQTKVWASEFSVRTCENYPHLSDRSQNRLMSNPAF